jgi:hypothetical protein
VILSTLPQNEGSSLIFRGVISCCPVVLHAGSLLQPPQRSPRNCLSSCTTPIRQASGTYRISTSMCDTYPGLRPARCSLELNGPTLSWFQAPRTGFAQRNGAVAHWLVHRPTVRSESETLSRSRAPWSQHGTAGNDRLIGGRFSASSLRALLLGLVRCFNTHFEAVDVFLCIGRN